MIDTARPGRSRLHLEAEKFPFSSYRAPSSSYDHDEEETFTDYSAYNTPVGTKPILDLYADTRNGRNGKNSLVRRRRRFNFSRGGPHSVMRWLCWGVLVSLVMFILILFRAHLVSTIIRPADPIIPEVNKPPKPHAWESFSFLKRFYGGIRTLVPREENVPEYPGDELVAEEQQKAEDSENKNGEKEQEEEIGDEQNDNAARDGKNVKELTVSSSVFNPYPDYTSKRYIQQYGTKVECFLDANGTIKLPHLQRYDGVPKGFPDAVMGSNEMLGIKDDGCFDRFGRLGPYGLGYGKNSGGIGAGLEGDREGIDNVWEDVPPVDFRGINWAEAQERCVVANRHRFPDLPAPRLDRFRAFPLGSQNKPMEKPTQPRPPKGVVVGSQRVPKTAVLIRTWTGYNYKEETILYLRSLIAELSIMSGGEYEVFFLVHVKDNNLQIWSDDETYERVLRDSLPEEFRGMGILWSERQMGLIYGGLHESMMRNLPVHGVYRSTFMPVQYFAFQHPEYDYYWNWEMDIRYTGHWYHLFDKVGAWARKQPRKGLWERNARFYVPDVHGSWEDFRQMVRVQTERGTNSPGNFFIPPNQGKPSLDQLKQQPPKGEKPIWGPERPPAEEDILEVEDEGIPKVPYEKDKYEWGVGEDADLIVFNPLFDPEGTTWLLRDDVTGYNTENGTIPRRTAIITASRLSRKLLHTMHRETSLKRHTMFSEMWPATTCLHHGFKAVYVPHSVYIDRRWPTQYLESVFNAGRNGASGGARASIFGDNEHNFKGTTWFYSAGHSANLWKRWLGYKVNNDGGEEEEVNGEGRMCLPPILLHPVKEVEMIIESADGDE
ncbi:hypothetical protein VTO42DRAFT_1487 [Malbranchea cinnamomea]